MCCITTHRHEGRLKCKGSQEGAPETQRQIQAQLESARAELRTTEDALQTLQVAPLVSGKGLIDCILEV